MYILTGVYYHNIKYFYTWYKVKNYKELCLKVIPKKFVKNHFILLTETESC